MTPNPEIPRVQVAGNPGRTLRRVWLLAALVKETGKPNARLRLRHERGKREALLPLPALPHPRLSGNRACSTNASAGRATCAPEGDGPQEALGGGPRSPTRGTPGTALEQGAPDAAKPARGKAAPLLGQQFAQRNRPPRGTVVPLCRCSHGRGQNAPSVLRATESLAGFD